MPFLHRNKLCITYTGMPFLHRNKSCITYTGMPFLHRNKSCITYTGMPFLHRNKSCITYTGMPFLNRNKSCITQCPPNSSDRQTGRTNMWSVRFASFPVGPNCPMLFQILCILCILRVRQIEVQSYEMILLTGPNVLWSSTKFRGHCITYTGMPFLHRNKSCIIYTGMPSSPPSPPWNCSPSPTASGPERYIVCLCLNIYKKAKAW